jgi:hypothetical protein
MTQRSLPGFAAETVPTNPASDASSTRAVGVLLTAVAPAPRPRASAAHAKGSGVHRHRQQVTDRYSAALWRPDATVGPNPGGGFYGRPNVNVRHINPR